ncbi:MAG: right-handed parallel beta-helix repeat-containing protein [Clostridia bacterium]|nr:right-handed parallel beta-helix repeat-containing protein [Clostridia bacterium]
MGRIYHVSKQGNDKNAGTQEMPFFTISRAAGIAEAGDTVIVHEGIYRESVSPANSGKNQSRRIVFCAAENEKAVIKGSEVITGWRNMDGISVAEIPKSLFGDYNPFAQLLDGDWLVEPIDPLLHTGMVYIDGRAMKEVCGKNEVVKTEMSFYAEVFDEKTVVYANFAGADPDKSEIEVNVRKTCFFPEITGINYITVRGFEMAQAATVWSPPTAQQFGMLGVNWSKGWIIEDNILHDSRCSAICVGKEISTGHNLYSRYHTKPGYQFQLETAFSAVHNGWDKETIGSHIIRNNIIYDCGQNGIVGNLGGAFSEIYSNHIYNIGNKHEFFGWEIAGIKLHAAIDTVIRDNVIHDCWLGTWLDWQAQGTRVTSNLYYGNEKDLFIEVTHGPHLIDNNIFASAVSLQNAAQGGAYINNIFMGEIIYYEVRDRSTPYHLNHSTELMGTAVVYGADDRFYQNIFVGNPGNNDEFMYYGTNYYNGCPVSMEEYIDRVRANGRGDIEVYYNVRQPAYIEKNIYINCAKPFDGEKENIVSETVNSNAVITEGSDIYLEINIPHDIEKIDTQIMSTENIPTPRISEHPFENPDGTLLFLDRDFFGRDRRIRNGIGPVSDIRAGYNKIKLNK